MQNLITYQDRKTPLNPIPIPMGWTSMARETMDVSVIIVNYNVRELLRQALTSVLQAAESVQAEIIVVDNNSVDGSPAMVRQEFPDVTLLANNENLGFATANNQGIRHASGRYLLILNPDTIIQEDTLETLVRFMDSTPDAGAAGCKILNPDGSFARESRRSFPTPRVALYRMAGLSRLFSRSRRFGKYNLSYLPEDEVCEVDALSGSCMVVRKEAIEHGRPTNQVPQPGAGLLDEEFFMYGEDLDWCYRIQKAGWKIYYTPETQIIHYKGASTRKSELRYVRLFHGAMLRFANKHLQEDYPRFFLWCLRLAVIARGAITAVVGWLRHPALTDFLLLSGTLSALGWYRSATLASGFPLLFYLVVAPGFAAAATTGIGAMGGYRGKALRIGPVLAGVTVAVASLAVASFFIKQIAFSRAIVLASLPAGLLVLAATRLIRRGIRPVRGRTLLVGKETHVADIVTGLHPKLSLAGFVGPIPDAADYSQNGVPRLGAIHQLRDVVKLHGIRDVVFAASSLSNKDIFALLRHLQGLRVRCRILAADSEPSTGHESTLVRAEDAIGALPASSRVFGALAALIGAAAYPFVASVARLRGGKWSTLMRRTRLWPQVLLGKRPLVGFRGSDSYVPPPEWGLEEGVFAVTDALDPGEDNAAEQAYWYYVRNQSAVLDWIIVMRAIRLMR